MGMFETLLATLDPLGGVVVGWFLGIASTLVLQKMAWRRESAA